MTQIPPKSRVSVRDLAAKLGVSNATVSRALNNHPEVAEETRIRVMELAEATGYRAKTPAKRTGTIGLVYPADPIRPEHGSFESAMLSGILTGVNEQRFDVTWTNIERDMSPEESFTSFFRRKGVSGVVLRTIIPGSDLAERIAAEGFPCVLIAGHSEDERVNFIYSDSRADSCRAVEHLVHLGHRRIGLSMHAVADSDIEDRKQGYLDGLQRHGIEIDPALMISATGTLDGGRQAIDRLLGLERPPTAVYLTTPPATLGALQRCLELGIRVPRDLSIVGFDDSDTRLHAFPRFTAVCQDAGQMGLEAARWLTRSVSGMGVGPLREKRPTTFVVQHSTAIAPIESVRVTPAGLERVAVPDPSKGDGA